MGLFDNMKHIVEISASPRTFSFRNSDKFVELSARVFVDVQGKVLGVGSYTGIEQSETIDLFGEKYDHRKFDALQSFLLYGTQQVDATGGKQLIRPRYIVSGIESFHNSLYGYEFVVLGSALQRLQARKVEFVSNGKVLYEF